VKTSLADAEILIEFAKQMYEANCGEGMLRPTFGSPTPALSVACSERHHRHIFTYLYLTGAHIMGVHPGMCPSCWLMGNYYLLASLLVTLPCQCSIIAYRRWHTLRPTKLWEFAEGGVGWE
jgi:hypothetical protein